eukprot:NODE_8933_length_633_cov_31.592157_g8305_i0.p1 GENE.NODE_8933_length_633_cov_31.592157_g8305_i0~~NODE_8933_length_633_cov_31.592157_g8305_i0.p1  ORF type:complete len:156 (+),score=37.12 NODE_8933_length_633_cov_31.592157_g8305_i0:73-540(+)
MAARWWTTDKAQAKGGNAPDLMSLAAKDDQVVLQQLVKRIFTVVQETGEITTLAVAQVWRQANGGGRVEDFMKANPDLFTLRVHDGVMLVKRTIQSPNLKEYKINPVGKGATSSKDKKRTASVLDDLEPPPLIPPPKKLLPTGSFALWNDMNLKK